MTGSWSGRGRSTSPAAQAAQQALDAAVSAFLDLDTRQSYVADAMNALGDLEDTPFGGSPSLSHQWAQVSEQCMRASADYLATADRYALTDHLGRPTGVDPAAAQSAFTQVHRGLADAATAVDSFYRKHSSELENARAQRSLAPELATKAKQAAAQAEQALSKAESEGTAYASVQTAADTLIESLGRLNSAEQAGSPGPIRKAAASVQDAAKLVQDRVNAAGALLPQVRGALASVRTRVEAVTTRLSSLPQTQSALLREFSADSTKDLTGVDRRAQAGLDQARAEWEEAGKTLQAGKAEQAADHLARAREHLSAAEADASALTERLRLLRETKADPQQAAKQARFKVRDAQLLVVGKGLVPQWGSVLDAQVERIDRAVADLVGPHPNYWAYLQTLDAVESFVRDVVDRIRGELR